MSAPRSLLIIQTAFIGDVILATALVESIHHQFPRCEIDFLVRKGNESLLADHPFLRRVLVFDKSSKYLNLIRLIRQVRDAHYDIVVNAQRFATTGLLTILSGAENTIGFDKNPLSAFFTRKARHTVDNIHEVDRNHRLIESLTGSERQKPRLYPSQAQREKVRRFQSKPYVTISPASVWYTKQFPESRWPEVIRRIDAGYVVYLLGAPDDKALCERIAASLPGRDVVTLAGQLSLLESAALMEGARLNFVNDSAPMHLASATNAPVCALYCSTVPEFGFGPLSDQRQILQTKENLSCRPCGFHGYKKCPEGHFKCAMTIDVSAISFPPPSSLPAS